MRVATPAKTRTAMPMPGSRFTSGIRSEAATYSVTPAEAAIARDRSADRRDAIEVHLVTTEKVIRRFDNHDSRPAGNSRRSSQRWRH